MWNEKNKILWLLISVFAVVACFYVFAGRADKSKNGKESTTPPYGSNLNVPATQSAGEIPPGSKEYRNTAYKFSLFYPEDLTIKEYKEADGGLTVTFKDETNEKAFQIFVVPYGDKEITAGRFRADVPSGVIKDKTDIIIDRNPATMFWSENAVLGETREVWFIKNGFLYEVTTYKPLDEWLGNIMKTWRFL